MGINRVIIGIKEKKKSAMEYAVEIISLIKNTSCSFRTQLGMLVFQKTEIYCNRTIHVHICYKWDFKKIVRNFYYIHQQYALDASHFCLWLLVHVVSLIEWVRALWTFCDVILFHIKQVMYCYIPIVVFLFFLQLLTSIQIELRSCICD